MDGIRIVAGKDVTKENIAQALQLDIISYDDIFHLQLETCLEYFEKNSEIYIMAIEETSQRVVGYINFSPITDQLYAMLSSGEVVDTIITKDDIVSYNDQMTCKGYFSSIVVHPQFRKNGIAKAMLRRWEELICYLAEERGIFFSDIVADAVSDIGAHLLSEIGFSIVNSSMHNSTIMTINLTGEDIIRTELNAGILDTYVRCGGRNGNV